LIHEWGVLIQERDVFIDSWQSWGVLIHGWGVFIPERDGFINSWKSWGVLIHGLIPG